MTGARQTTKPSFFWQAALILLPVIVLAVVGWLSLRQDRRLAQREAEDRAQIIADDLAAKIWNALTGEATNRSRLPSFRIDERGRLLSPPPYAPIPTPRPLALSELNPKQQQLWKLIQSTEIQMNDNSFAQTFEDFLQTEPPENFAATAHYDRGLWCLRKKQIPEAMARFDLVAEEYPEAVGESGLPLRQLALMKLLMLEPHEKGNATPLKARRVKTRPAWTQYPVEPERLSFELEHYVSLDYVCSNLVCQPTPLTAYLLQEIETRWSSQIPTGVLTTAVLDRLNQAGTPEMQETIDSWQRVWREHELSRELFAAAHGFFQTNTSRSQLFWFQTPRAVKIHLAGDANSGSGFEIEAQRWLAFRADTNTAEQSYVCLPEAEIGMRIETLMQNTRTLPEYFGISLELVGKRVEEFAPDLFLWTYQAHAGKSGGATAKVQRQDVFTHTPLAATEVLATTTLTDVGPEILKLRIYLTNPDALFAHQSARRLWFGLLITLSVLAALTGLIAARRAFHRQLRLNEMKSNFVSSVSHELRAPIASVRLLAESLERGKISEPAKQNEYFRFIGQECRRLSALIENVLDFSRIEQGRKQYEFEPTDMSALVEQTVKLMQPYAEERGVVLKSEVRSLRSEMEVDGRAMQQALVNLIDNAIKHSPKGKAVSVEIKTNGETSNLEPRTSNLEPRTSNLEPRTLNFESASDHARSAASIHHPPSTIHLSVSDHGPGIPASEHEKIFERFYRLGSELRRETQGVGIGLSIVKHVVEAHGGRVRVESEVGQGSRFTIELPAAQQEQTEKTEEEK
jgi:signal transduction histidine kinase